MSLTITPFGNFQVASCHPSLCQSNIIQLDFGFPNIAMEAQRQRKRPGTHETLSVGVVEELGV